VSHFLDTCFPDFLTRIPLGRGEARSPGKSHGSPPNECQNSAFLYRGILAIQGSARDVLLFFRRATWTAIPVQTTAFFGGWKSFPGEWNTDAVFPRWMKPFIPDASDFVPAEI